ncbi:MULTISPECIES: NRDE family protein [unclassified Curtobacterium]|uniref:NRDE family protein n=1 Tax=unclassified Curtobacterium TaxID=257496 RepID=UPI000DAA68D5|nr:MULTISPECIES: NRDE family protein [unclassified Curtobacterium]PZF56222.1 hypothetical protein DEI92_15135 [Curtobacterium sp. MCBD17_034]PZM32873.1 hypothetical protein DEI90_15615 [Curtobacterium sp. MCBD17_031]WIE53767.1 NRDE family protein [Curtobacterium sp. MCBD17_003]
MCTVVVRVEPDTAWPVTLLALRDEDPSRPWDPPRAWWQDRGDDVVGVRDRTAGGAWLAASAPRRALAVVLNRAEPVPATDGGWATRGWLPLDAVTGATRAGERPTERSYNLVHATPQGVRVTSWDGARVLTRGLGPGVHVVTEGAPDDVALPRIARWLDPFRDASAPVGPPPSIEPLLAAEAPTTGLGADWEDWFAVLRSGADVAPDRPDAILRDDLRADGRFATLSVVAAAVGPSGVVLEHARLATPGRLGTRS